MVLTGQTTFGVLVALIQLSNQIQFFVYSLGGTITRIQTALAAADRILDVLDTKPEPESYQAVRVHLAGAPKPNALLEFKDVHFSYDGGKEVLQGLSFEVQKGNIAAFVGSSGGGKSTIFRLLLGCHPVQRGSVFISGKSMHKYELVELRDQFAYIPQDAYLYSGTILSNIRYGKPKADRDQIIAAAQAANAHNFIMEFPDGYETVVGERGARLSGRQPFIQFTQLCAGRIGQLLNYASLASDAGISPNTAKAWLSILESSYILYRLQPYHRNFNKRLVKSPKLYFYDTGIACSLLGIREENQVSSHYLKGGLFENLILNEFIKRNFHRGENRLPYFWKDNHGKEIDCLLVNGEKITPVEIKSGKTMSTSYFDNLQYWQQLTAIPENHGYVFMEGNSPCRRVLDLSSVGES